MANAVIVWPGQPYLRVPSEGSAATDMVVLPVAPKKSSGKIRKVMFQQDPETKRIFITVFDAESGSCYTFEPDYLKGSKILELPSTKDSESIHVQLS